MTNFFTRTEYRQTDHNYQMIYNNLKTETVDKIENEIENYYSKYGSIFLNSIMFLLFKNVNKINVFNFLCSKS